MVNREIDEQEKYQLREIVKTMNSEGWTYLMAAWIQMREGKIINSLKKARTEMPWRYNQGKLDGFDEAMNLAEKLVSTIVEEVGAKSAQEEAEEIIRAVQTGQ